MRSEHPVKDKKRRKPQKMAPQENRFNIAQGYHKEKGEKSPHPFNKILFLCTLANLQHNSQQGHGYKHLHNHELNQHLGGRPTVIVPHVVMKGKAYL